MTNKAAKNLFFAAFVRSKPQKWSEWHDSNVRSPHPKCGAVPAPLHPDIWFWTIIARNSCNGNIFLSVVIHVVKTTFVPLSTTGANPVNAVVARLFGVSPCPAPDTATAHPKQALYQLRYTPINIQLWPCNCPNMRPDTFPASLLISQTMRSARLNCIRKDCFFIGDSFFIIT